MSWQGAWFKVASPLTFKGPEEFSPMSRGPLASARCLPLPLPSTIAGALASLIVNLFGRKPISGGWVEEVLSVLGQDFRMKGPYLVVGDDVFVQYGEDKLVNVEDLGVLSKTHEELLKYAQREGGLEELLKRSLKPVSSIKTQRVGIGLRVRADGAKVVEEERGLIYTIEEVDYRVLGSPAYIAADVSGLELDNLKGSIVKFGGEGRFAKLQVEKPRLYDFVNSMLADFKGGYVNVYVASYALLKASEGAGYEKVNPMCYIFPSYVNRLRELVENFGAKLKGVIGSLRLIGTGYSILRGTKKPMYATLVPGTILLLYCSPQAVRAMFERGLSEIGFELGFGTIVPIAVKSS